MLQHILRDYEIISITTKIIDVSYFAVTCVARSKVLRWPWLNDVYRGNITAVLADDFRQNSRTTAEVGNMNFP
jgi:hypothetical protein